MHFLIDMRRSFETRKCAKRTTGFVLTVLFAAICHTQALAQDKLSQRVDAPDVTSAAGRTAAGRSSTSTEEEIDKLKVVVADQQRRIEQLEVLVNDQRKLIDQVLQPHAAANRAGEELNGNPAAPAEVKAAENTPALPAPAEPIRKVPQDEASPLTVRIGKVSVTPYGFLDLTAIVRDKNVGSGIGTNFGSIPLSNTVAGHLSEFRLTAQATRLGARFDAHRGNNEVLGLFESDFVGFAPSNVAVTTNSDSFRLRLAWVDVHKGKWEVLGGQSWSLLTPNRKGTSPVPADIFATQNMDQSIQVGQTWARQPQFRVMYHPNHTVTFGVSLEAAEQYGGGSAGAGEITLPAGLVNSYTSQFDLGESTFAAPNLHPDVIAKLAFDPKVGRHDLHFEVAGLLSSFRFFNPQDQQKHSATGGGILVGLNYEAFKNFRIIANGYYSNGGGRYIFGLAPNVIINADGRPSLLHSASTVTGFEYQANPNNLFDAYYGGAYIYRSATRDLNGQLVGYGYAGGPSNQNRALQQITFGYTRTFWRDPNYGALQMLSQYSYVMRRPWSVAAGQPIGANLNFVYLTIRYLLPGAPPAKK